MKKNWINVFAAACLSIAFGLTSCSTDNTTGVDDTTTDEMETDDMTTGEDMLNDTASIGTPTDTVGTTTGTTTE